ncbi:MAG: SRPBCC family protein [Bacteroidota bacterium]
MKVYKLRTEQLLPISLEEAWDFFSTPKNLDAITPPDMSFQILSGADERMYSGQLITYKIRPLFNIPMNWVTEITHCVEKSYFVDEQRFGPYRFWHHQHHFTETDKGVLMVDLLHYGLPMGWLGEAVAGQFISNKVNHIFEYRYQILEAHFNNSTNKKEVVASNY